MRRLVTVVLAAFALPALAWAGPVAPAHGFRNGGFEKGDFAGWQLAAPYTEVIDQDYDGYAPHGGSDYALLGARGVDGTLSQTFLDVTGETLRIGFWLASDGSADTLALSFDGHALLSLTDLPRQGWSYYSADVTATGIDGLTFSFRDDSGYLALDSVTVRAAPGQALAAVPEPASLGLLGMGLAAAWRARKRKQGVLF